MRNLAKSQVPQVHNQADAMSMHGNIIQHTLSQEGLKPTRRASIVPVTQARAGSHPHLLVALDRERCGVHVVWREHHNGTAVAVFVRQHLQDVARFPQQIRMHRSI